MTLMSAQSADLLDAFCRVESGIITETHIEETVDGIKVYRPIREQDIVHRGHPTDWYLRVTRINSVAVPQYHRRRMNFRLVRLPDTTITAEVDEYVQVPTISELLNHFSNEKVKKWTDLSEYAQKLMIGLITTAMTNSIGRFCQSRRYSSIESAIRLIGCHISKYDTEGRRVQYLYAETWAKFEWYMEQLKADLVPFPTQATDILQHFPRLTWSDTDTEAAVSDSTASGNTDTADTPSV